MFRYKVVMGGEVCELVVPKSLEHWLGQGIRATVICRIDEPGSWFCIVRYPEDSHRAPTWDGKDQT
jgi:hypothetical protein